MFPTICYDLTMMKRNRLSRPLPKNQIRSLLSACKSFPVLAHK
jgi:hypothetical protein